MGAQQSSRVNKDEKDRRKNVQNHIISQRKEEISAIQNHVVSNAVKEGMLDVKVIKEVIQATTHAQNQLERGGKPFNKGDLVAIIIALDNKQVNNIDKLNSYRIEDLNALIRVIVYDTKNFVSENTMISDRTNNTNKINHPTKQSETMVLKNDIVNTPPPLPHKKNMLTLTYDHPPSYALVRR